MLVGWRRDRRHIELGLGSPVKKWPFGFAQGERVRSDPPALKPASGRQAAAGRRVASGPSQEPLTSKLGASWVNEWREEGGKADKQIPRYARNDIFGWYFGTC